MEYWAIINNVQTGPMQPDQIAALGITPDTMVWCNGMSRWEKARYVADFAPYLPPAFAPGDNPQPFYTNQPPLPMPSSYLVWSIISIFLCFQITGAIALVYSLLVEYRYNHQNYQGALRASKYAKNFNIASAVISLLWIPFVVMTGIFSGIISVLI